MGNFNRNRQIAKYDWERWFASGIFYLRKGRDFNITTASMISMVRNNAPKYGISVKVNCVEDGLIRVEVLPEQVSTKRHRRK